MSDASGSTTRIRIAKLQFCHDNECQVVTGLDVHLIVAFDYVELSKTKALAVSYAWGEFDRGDVVIGHDASGRSVSLNLGQEWGVQETVVQLAMLCIENGEEHGDEHAGIWLDQLCIEQSSHDKVRAALASIPAIYRDLEVIVMLPGGNCACVQEVFDGLRALRPDASLVEFEQVLYGQTGTSAELRSSEPAGEMSDARGSCRNYPGACSYFDRMWTRQELLYATSARVVRTQVDVLPCVRTERDVANLSSFAYQLYNRQPDSDTWDIRLFGIQGDFIDGLLQSIEELERPDIFLAGTRRNHWGGLMTALEFLLGYKLIRRKKIGQGGDSSDPFYFFRELAKLAVSTRKATKPNDYVVSVWVDCPKYELPLDFDSMSLPSLFEDAIKQMEQKFGASIWTSRLPGLFSGDTNGSVIWRPTSHIPANPENASELYGPILQAEPLRMFNNYHFVPLSVSWPIVEPLSRTAQEYAQHFSGQAVEDVLRDLRAIVREWAATPIKRLVRALQSWGRFIYHLNEGEEFNSRNFDLMQFSSNLLFVQPGIITSINPHLNEIINMTRLPPCFDHHDAMYVVVASSLGLDPEDCRSHGLRLMIVPEMKMIGFISKNELGLGTSAISEVISLTTATHPESEVGILEARLSDNMWCHPSGKTYPRYSAVGIWVPLQAGFTGTMTTTVGLQFFNAVLQ